MAAPRMKSWRSCSTAGTWCVVVVDRSLCLGPFKAGLVLMCGVKIVWLPSKQKEVLHKIVQEGLVVHPFGISSLYPPICSLPPSFHSYTSSAAHSHTRTHAPACTRITTMIAHQHPRR